jgi:nitrite reductase/ring-hydroxylating ferredoxin subunit
MAGWICMFAGGYLGGHLVYRRRVGIDHADRSPEPRDFQPVLSLADLPENRPTRVEVRDENVRQNVGLVLVRRGNRVHALGARCSHMGGPLDQGWILGNALVCPWHGSRYDLETGQPVAGPSTCPQPRYGVRTRDGFVEIQREQEPGDHIVTSETLAKSAILLGEPLAEAAQPGKDAVKVLVEHHELIRRLFERIETTPGGDPQRRDLMRTLASELEIHEYVEDKLFYPAVWPVSEDIPVAHAEHRQVADLLAMTLKLSTAGQEFNEHLAALHAAFDHHAGSEERSMFPQSQRLGQARLRRLGQELETLLDEQRTSRFRQVGTTATHTPMPAVSCADAQCILHCRRKLGILSAMSLEASPRNFAAFCTNVIPSMQVIHTVSPI